MPKKYDTNPLEEEIFQRAEAERKETFDFAEGATRFLDEPQMQTPANATDTDFQTRRFAEPNNQTYSTFGNQGFQSIGNQTDYYQSVYAPPSVINPLSAANAGSLQNANQSSSRKVPKINLPENLLLMSAYLPISPVAIVMAIITLLTVTKTETKVRFHAAQGLALHFAAIGISIILGIADRFSDWADLAQGIFSLAAFICFIIWSIKAYKGKPIHIEAVDGLTDWLEDKITVKKG